MNLAPLPIAADAPALVPLDRCHEPQDRIHAVLLRRIDGCAERRSASALTPGEDAAFDAWKRERDRGDKLRRALIGYLNSDH